MKTKDKEKKELIEMCRCITTLKNKNTELYFGLKDLLFNIKKESC